MAQYRTCLSIFPVAGFPGFLGVERYSGLDEKRFGSTNVVSAPPGYNIWTRNRYSYFGPRSPKICRSNLIGRSLALSHHCVGTRAKVTTILVISSCSPSAAQAESAEARVVRLSIADGPLSGGRRGQPCRSFLVLHRSFNTRECLRSDRGRILTLRLLSFSLSSP